MNIMNNSVPTSVRQRSVLNEATTIMIDGPPTGIRRSIIDELKLNPKISRCCPTSIRKDMEDLLFIWIEDSLQKKAPIDKNTIKQKALKIYKEVEQSPKFQMTKRKQEFTANDAWMKYIFEKLVTQLGVFSEDNLDAFSSLFPRIVNIGGYTPDQVFNAVECGLYWKKMLSRSFIGQSDNSGSAFVADRITMLLCSNASGDRMLKPLLINRILKPPLLKNRNVNNMPVHWMANFTGWMIRDLFEKWFNECFIPEVKQYLEGKGLTFKVLLLLDHTHAHMNVSNPNVRILRLPPNSAPVTLPLDNGVIPLFKINYIKQLFHYFFNSPNGGNRAILLAWNKYTILDCIKNVSLAVHQLNATTLNACWKAIWPACVKSENAIQEHFMGFSDIIFMAHTIGGEGFSDMRAEDINELIYDCPMNDEEFTELINNGGYISFIDEDDQEYLDANKAQEGLELATNIENYFFKYDTDVNRAARFQKMLRAYLQSDVKNCKENEKYTPYPERSPRFHTDNQIQEGLALATDIENYFIRYDPNRNRVVRFQKMLRGYLQLCVNNCRRNPSARSITTGDD